MLDNRKSFLVARISAQVSYPRELCCSSIFLSAPLHSAPVTFVGSLTMIERDSPPAAPPHPRATPLEPLDLGTSEVVRKW